MGLAPDPIDRSRALSTRLVPTLAAPEQPIERLVPENRLRDHGTGKEIVIPPDYGRPITVFYRDKEENHEAKY